MRRDSDLIIIFAIVGALLAGFLLWGVISVVGSVVIALFSAAAAVVIGLINAALSVFIALMKVFLSPVIGLAVIAIAIWFLYRRANGPVAPRE